MTTRRSFFKSLALIGSAAAGCPGIFIPKFEPVRWKSISRIIPITPFAEIIIGGEVFLLDQTGKWNPVLPEQRVRTTS